MPDDLSREIGVEKERIAPSKWRTCLAESLDDLARIEVQWATGTGSSLYKTFHTTPARARSVDDTWLIDAQSEVAPMAVGELADRLWSAAWDCFASLDQERGGDLQRMRTKLVCFDPKGNEISASGAEIRKPKGALVTDAEVTGAKDPEERKSIRETNMALALVREMKNERRELVADNRSNATMIANLAKEVGNMTGKVAQAFSNAMDMQANTLQKRLDMLEDREDDREMQYRVSQAFDRAERWIGMWFQYKTGATPGGTPDAPGRVCTLAAEGLALVTEDQWSALDEIDAEVFADLHTALSKAHDGDDAALVAALSVVLPRLVQYGPQIQATLSPEARAKFMEIQAIVFPSPGA